MGAVGLILLPHAVENTVLWLTVLVFCAGGLLGMGLDRFTLRKMEGSGSSTLAAMVLDFVPEGFAAYSADANGDGPAAGNRMLLLLMGLPLVGIAAAAFGFFVCELDHVFLGAIMAGASGGILYLTLRRIVPESSTAGCGPWPAYGGVIGFVVALIGFGFSGH